MKPWTVLDVAWERIQVTTRRWEGILGLTNLAIAHRRLDALADEPHQKTVAQTKAAWEYRQASIEWFVPNVCTIEDDELERIVVHELCHILVAPMESLITPNRHLKACEFAVQSVADAILAGVKYALEHSS